MDTLYLTTEKPPDAKPPVPWGVAEALAMYVAFWVAQLVMGAGVGIWYGIAHHSGPDVPLMPPGWALTSSSALGQVAVLILIWAMIRISYGLPFTNGIRWEGSKRGIKTALLAGLALPVINSVSTLIFAPPDPAEIPLIKMISTPLDLAVFSVFAIAVAPLVEELLFRGWMYPAFEKKMGPVAAVVVTTLLFAAPHIFQLGSYAFGVVLIGFLGIATGILRARTGGVAAPFVCHLLYNVILVLMEVAGRVSGHGPGGMP